MKKILTLIVFLIYNTMLFSQEKDSFLVGEWKIICIQTHNYYYNSVNDSLFYFKEFKKTIPDILKSEIFKFKDLADFNENTKKESVNFKFIFEKNQTYIKTKEDKIISKGKYTIDSLTKKIYLGGKEKPRHIMEYYIDNELLYLTFNDYESGIKVGNKTIYLRPTKYTLKRI